ncbi:hypothetical protein BDK89_0143 [Ilumatobacter fluminis]|uniref:Uncharacterized protein n=1 Tax=Ilumatobacter fluminis TaxID=467091 RepID=A0A4V3EIS9_9ACTN|nr:hypothetical protein BDK89_0143 [Ilumatobacter fluminis]
MTRSTTTRLVVSCSNRKSATTPDGLMARHLDPSIAVAKRCQQWVECLSDSDAMVVPAESLYQGEHWTVSTSIPALAPRGRQVELWVASAGYGLIRSTAPLRSYSAAFSDGADRVAVGGDRSAWWSELANWEGPEPGQPRTLASLAKSHPKDSLLVALSPPYLRACVDDLLAARSTLADPSQMTVVCLGGQAPPGLRDSAPPVDARVQAELGGSRQALNARVARYLVTERADSSLLEATKALEMLVSRQPELRRFDRTPTSDDRVSAFIRRRVDEDSSATKTALLREYRASGFACEQHRFGRLFKEVLANNGPQ